LAVEKEPQIGDHLVSKDFDRAMRRSHRRTIFTAFDRRKNTVLKWSLAIALFGVVAVYFALPVSKVRAVSVEGNVLLSSSYIKETASIDQDQRFFLTIPFYTEYKLKKDPLIEDASVTLGRDHVVHISVTEKKAVGYRYEDKPEILFADGTKTELKSEYLDLIADVPLINGFTSDEDTRLLTKAFQDVEPSVIAEISEIDQYDLSYDDESMRVLMRNGGYFIANFHDFYLINQYNAIYSKLKNRNLCIFAFASEENNTAYAKVCPWDETDANTEYWQNEDGSYVKNANGDMVAKHYYSLEDGSQAKDANGNPIPIPIDENGTEVPDADFQTNYNNGYYANGVLSLPQG
jgi:cell division protein FtsQ